MGFLELDGSFFLIHQLNLYVPDLLQVHLNFLEGYKFLQTVRNFAVLARIYIYELIIINLQ